MSKYRLLGVDDSKTIREFLKYGLTDYDVTVVETGEEALQEVRNSDTPPFDVIILDIELPGMDGFEVTKQIKEIPEYEETPIFFLSVHSSEDVQARVKGIGAKALLAKPNIKTIDQLQAAIRSHLNPSP